MEYTNWTIFNKSYEAQRKRSRDALFAIGNGYFGIRGFFEEDLEGVDSYGGIYMAGIFGKGSYKAWEGESRELCNVSNILRARINIAGEPATVKEGVTEFLQQVDLKSGTYTRSYIFQTAKGKRVKLNFFRFASLSNKHLVGQKIEIESFDDVELQVNLEIDTKVRNLNQESCEPLPIQPGRDHIVSRKISTNRVETLLDDVEETRLFFHQTVTGWLNDQALEGTDHQNNQTAGISYKSHLKPSDKVVFQKLITVYTSKDEEVKEQELSLSDKDYDTELAAHRDAWEKKWDESDIKIKTTMIDQTVIRFNIFHLLCVCPEHTDKLSIGARGLTGEMYEGCVFWDTEIFKLPFFIYTNPQAAKKLLTFRYHTLEAARRHAKTNWFDGAMYPWQASEKGIEQTPYNVGAYYAIHIVSDIAYAIQQYWEVTGDNDFMVDYGTEILIETARFFVSRSDYDERDGRYHIRAVRGPNEYDVCVNDNAYTNVMAIENFKTAKRAVHDMSLNSPQCYTQLKTRIGFQEEEMKEWEQRISSLKIPYDPKRDLYEEDDAYFSRRPLDMKKAKPTGKRIIDSTLPYEALPLYQVTKQADVVLLMNLLPHLFTNEQKKNAYDYYEPRTAHDSSLSYAPYGVLSAHLGDHEEAYGYFRKSAYLDIEDLQLNTISGLHFANFGGSWQLVYFGYGGISQKDGVLFVEPNLPKEWEEMELTVAFKGTKVRLRMNNQRVHILAKDLGLNQECKLMVFGRAVKLEEGGQEVVIERDSV